MTDECGPVVADTHTFAWYVLASPRLSDAARDALRGAAAAQSPILVSAVSLVELRYLLEKRACTENQFAAFQAALRAPDTACKIAPFDRNIAETVSELPRELIPDPFDRMIGATALTLGLPLVTADRKLRSLSAVDTIW